METLTSVIQARLEKVKDQIALASQSAGREMNDIRLVVVTKAQPVEVIQAAVQAGARILGENYPEESLPKIQAVAATESIEWHMIGHLQSRKAVLVADHFSMLHSLDSFRLAERLDRRLAESGKCLPVLLEFNVGDETSKGGWLAGPDAHWDAWLPEIEQVVGLPHLQVKGVMCMPPLFEDPELARPYFVQARRVLDYLADRFPQAGPWNELSMGTSSDYPVAIQEGATYVRVGTAIVGARPRREA
jgi:pyridoxal phosphate enzyme (YggS family)